MPFVFCFFCFFQDLAFSPPVAPRLCFESHGWGLQLVQWLQIPHAVRRPGFQEFPSCETMQCKLARFQKRMLLQYGMSWCFLQIQEKHIETLRACWPHSAKRLDSHREKHETSRNPESWNCSGLEALCRSTASAFRDLFGFQEIRPVSPQWRHHPHGSHCQALEALFAGGLVPNSQLFGIFSLFLNPRV